MPNAIDILDKKTIAKYFLEAQEYCKAISLEKLKVLFKDDELQEDLLIDFPKLHQCIFDAKNTHATDVQKAISEVFRAAIYAKMLWSFNPYLYNSIEYLIKSILEENPSDDKEKIIFYGNTKNSSPCKMHIVGIDHPVISSITLPLSPTEADRYLSYLVIIITSLFKCDDIYLDNIGITTKSAKLLRQIPCHTLSINCNPLSDDGIKVLLDENTCYQEMNVAYCDIKDAGAHVIANSSLRSVNLANNMISNEGAIALANNGSIIELDISNNPVTDKGIIALAKKTNLRKLNLSDLKLSEDALEALALHPTLTSLTVGATHRDNDLYLKTMLSKDPNEKNQATFDFYKISEKGAAVFNEFLKQNYTLISIKTDRLIGCISNFFQFADILKRNKIIHLMETRDAITNALKEATTCTTLQEAQNALNLLKHAKEKIISSQTALALETSDIANAIKHELKDKLALCNQTSISTIHHYFDNLYMHSDQTHPISLLMECCKILVSEDGQFLIDFSDKAFNIRFDLLLSKTMNPTDQNYNKPYNRPLIELKHLDRLLILSQVVAHWQYSPEDYVFYLLLMLNIGEQMAIAIVNPEDMNNILNKLKHQAVTNEQFRNTLMMITSLERAHPGLIGRLRTALMNTDSLQLDLNNLKLTDDAFSKILSIVSTFPNYKRAKVRVLKKAKKDDSDYDDIVNYQSDFYSLQNVLRLNGNEFSTKTIDILSKNTVFSTVTLENNGLGDDDVLLLASNPHFRVLELANNHISTKGVEGLAKYPHLRQLDLSSNPVQVDLVLSLLKNTYLVNVIVDPSLTLENVALFPSMLINYFVTYIKGLRKQFDKIQKSLRDWSMCTAERTPSDGEIILDEIYPLLKRNQLLELGITIDMAKEALDIQSAALYSIDELTIIHQRLATVLERFSNSLHRNQEITDKIKDLLSKAEKDIIEKIEHEYAEFKNHGNDWYLNDLKTEHQCLSTGLELLSDSMKNSKEKNEEIKNILLEFHQKIVAQINLLSKKPSFTSLNIDATLFNIPKTNTNSILNDTPLGFSKK